MTLDIADPSGGHVMTLLTDGTFNYRVWSPGSRQLAFIGRVQPGDRQVLWVMNSDGSNVHPVLPPGPIVCMELSPVGDPAENVRYEVTFAG